MSQRRCSPLSRAGSKHARDIKESVRVWAGGARGAARATCKATGRWGHRYIYIYI